MKSDLNPQVKASGTVLFFLITAVFLFYSVTLFLDIKDACAVTLTKTFNFATDEEDWTGNGGTSTTDTYQSDDGNPAGSLQSMITGGSKTNASAGWYISGITWESLGVPAGSTINSVDGKYDWRCSEYNRGDSNSASGNLFITDSADGNSTTLETRVTFSGTTSWATRNATGAVSIPVTLHASNTSIKIKLLGRLETRSSSGGSGTPTVTRRMDTVVLIIDYTPPTLPPLSYPAAPYDDGKDPDTGNTTTNFTFKVIYTDLGNDAPADYPKIYIGDNDGFFSYTMTEEDPADTTYNDGKTYYFTTGLGAAQDLRFYFEATTGDPTVVRLPSNAPEDSSTGPSVYLIGGSNMVGVPKDLGAAGLSYTSVLGDDSGRSYCSFWDSYGLDTAYGYSGDYYTCENIETGKGYYIKADASNSYRLDEEPSDVGNVTADYFDIALDPAGGWNIISNPYNVNIQLQDVKVARDVNEDGKFQESEIYTFSEAVNVPNEWIGNSIYEWEGYVTGYTSKAFNDSPPAILEPWVGYFIYVKDNTTPITLRVCKPGGTQC